MSGRGDQAAEPTAWRYRVALAAIPEGGLVEEFEAGAAERLAMGELAGLRDFPAARARFELRHVGRGRVQASGRITATVGQVCVVSLEPMESTIDEPVDALFVPADEVEAVTKALDREAEATGELADPPEPIINGMIDLGKVAADAVFLAIDPYPRKADVAFEPPKIAEDPDDHPFAALKALKGKPPAEPEET
jgi:uncharacterized metal-binding protein YceD (DUF177 family)